MFQGLKPLAIVSTTISAQSIRGYFYTLWNSHCEAFRTLHIKFGLIHLFDSKVQIQLLRVVPHSRRIMISRSNLNFSSCESVLELVI